MKEVSLDNLKFRRVYRFVVFNGIEIVGNIVGVKSKVIYVDTRYHQDNFAIIKGFHMEGINKIYLINEMPIKKDYKDIEVKCEMQFENELVPNGYNIYESCIVEGISIGCIYEFMYKGMDIRGKVVSVNGNEVHDKTYVLCDISYKEEDIWLYVLLDLEYLSDYEIQDEIPIHKTDNFEIGIRMI